MTGNSWAAFDPISKGGHINNIYIYLCVCMCVFSVEACHEDST